MSLNSSFAKLNALLLLTLLLLVATFANAKPGPQTQKLMQAARTGDLKSVKALAGQMDLNVTAEQKNTALMFASQAGQADVVQFLISKKVNLDAKNDAGESAISLAIQQEENAIAEKLIAAGAETNVTCGDKEQTLLMCAARTNAIPLIRMIAKKTSKEEIAKKDKAGKTALDYAKDYGTDEAVKILSRK